MTEFAEPTAAVTGAGSGFGAAMAHEFARAGIAVGVLDIDIDETASEATADALAGSGATSEALRVDVGDAVSIRHAVAPGAVDTDMVRRNPPKVQAHLAAASILTRITQPMRWWPGAPAHLGR